MKIDYNKFRNIIFLLFITKILKNKPFVIRCPTNNNIIIMKNPTLLKKVESTFAKEEESSLRRGGFQEDTYSDMITFILMILFYVINIVRCVVIPFCVKIPNITKHVLAELLTGVIGMLFLSVCFMMICKIIFIIIDKVGNLYSPRCHSILCMIMFIFVCFLILSYSVDDILS